MVCVVPMHDLLCFVAAAVDAVVVVVVGVVEVEYPRTTTWSVWFVMAVRLKNENSTNQWHSLPVCGLVVVVVVEPCCCCKFSGGKGVCLLYIMNV